MQHLLHCPERRHGARVAVEEVEHHRSKAVLYAGDVLQAGDVAVDGREADDAAGEEDGQVGVSSRKDEGDLDVWARQGAEEDLRLVCMSNVWGGVCMSIVDVCVKTLRGLYVVLHIFKSPRPSWLTLDTVLIATKMPTKPPTLRAGLRGWIKAQ